MSAVAQLVPKGKVQWTDANGNPLVGGSVYFYVPGTTTPANTWQDPNQTTLNTNPVVLDGRGEAVVYGVGEYRQVVYDVNGNLIWDELTFAMSTAAQLAGEGVPGGAGMVGFDGTTLDQIFLSRLNRVVDSIAALRTLLHTTYTRAFVTGYYGVGDGGGGSYYYNPTDTSTPDNGGTIIVAADGARWYLDVVGPVSIKQFGAKADNSTDDSTAIQNAINWCISAHNPLDIGQQNDCSAVGQQLVFSAPIEVVSDKTAALRFTNTASCGIALNFGATAASNNFLGSLSFPQLYSPAINSSLEIPGYGTSSPNYNLSSRVGQAISIQGANRINVYAHYIVGWNAGVQLTSTASALVGNLNVEVNTIDFCVYGIATYAPSAASYIGSVSFIANTIWAKYPIYIDGTNQSLVASEFHITGQAFTNEVDGAIIYGYNAGGKVDTCKFVVNWASAGYAYDSTAGTPTTLICPFLAGTATSNGALTDGNATLGYWAGTFCEFEIGPVMGYGGGRPSASPIPVAGNTIRIRDAGSYNTIRMRYSDNVATSPIPVTATQGEANYNGGVGSAQYAKRVLCSAAVPAIAAGASAAFYVYHQRVSAATSKAIKVIPLDSSLLSFGLAMFAGQDPTVNREIKVTIFNSGTTTSTATTVFFWLEVD